MGETASRAEQLVRRARRRATVHGTTRALLAGVAVAALGATAIVVVATLAGSGPGFWPLLGILAAIPVVGLRLRGVRPSRPAAALLLDRAAGTEERLLAAMTARDPDVRELVARQALDRPSLAGGAFPLRFPPSVEGLAAVLAVALLAGSLLLGPALVPEPEAAGGETPFTASVPGAETNTAGGDPVEPPGGGAAKAPGAPEISRIENGDDLTEGDWRELSAAGLTNEEREAIREALAAGDREGAAESARAAIRRAAGGSFGPGEGTEKPWGAYGQALESPGWSPRHDRVVREYFRVSGQRGLR